MISALCTFLHTLSTAPFWLSEATSQKAGAAGLRYSRLYKALGVRAFRLKVFRWRQRLLGSAGQGSPVRHEGEGQGDIGDRTICTCTGPAGVRRMTFVAFFLSIGRPLQSPRRGVGGAVLFEKNQRKTILRTPAGPVHVHMVRSSNRQMQWDPIGTPQEGKGRHTCYVPPRATQEHPGKISEPYAFQFAGPGKNSWPVSAGSGSILAALLAQAEATLRDAHNSRLCVIQA
jgi:hypothetical protein